MDLNRYEEGRFSDRARGLGTVTEDMIRQRAVGIAVRNGRDEHNVLESDIAQARRELTGKERLNPEPAPEEDIEAQERWEGNTGSAGSRAPTVPAPDEQTFAEKLVKEGVADAEHDRAERATREAFRRDEAV